MLGNTFGRLFRITTCGESYGKGKGSGLAVIVDGVPSGLKITREYIQNELDKRRPGQTPLDSPRLETDQCEIFAGLGQDGCTTGAPLGIMIYNVDTQQIHIDQYAEYKDLIRPGHAEYTFFTKYGEYTDWCGAGRASGRESVGRVACGAVAKYILEQENIEVIGFTQHAMGVTAKDMTFEEIKKNYRKNDINCPDPDAAEKMIAKVLKAKDEGDTAGGITEIRVKGIPAGLGEPVFDKISSLLAYAICSIGAVKGIEFGAGFKVGDMKGSECNDEPYLDENNNVRFKTNHSGGVLGGISNGEEIVMRVAVKPTPTISKPQGSINMKEMKEEVLSPITRRDPTLLGRWYPVGEAMTACVVLDALMMARGYDSICHFENKWKQI